MLVLNDLHVGFNRVGGTTPASREELRNYLLSSFEQIIKGEVGHICIMGDLFDSFEVSNRDWKDAYRILAEWLNNSHMDARLTLVAGNHDHSAKGDKVSSFELLCHVLQQQFYAQVQIIGIDEIDVVQEGIFALAHCSNQEAFNEKLKTLGSTFVYPGCSVFLHANYNNGYVAESDHSLNVSEAQARALIDKGAVICFAHEHQARTALDGKVVVWGNQWPTSVSDCLRNDFKFAQVFTGQGVDKVQTWNRNGDAGFSEINWRQLAGLVDSNDGFIRVVGNASANEAGDCISAIAKFRASSSAFVITNSVRIEGIAEDSDLPESFEAAKAFDVNAFIDGNLDEAQLVAVNRLRESQL